METVTKSLHNLYLCPACGRIKVSEWKKTRKKHVRNAILVGVGGADIRRILGLGLRRAAGTGTK